MTCPFLGREFQGWVLWVTEGPQESWLDSGPMEGLRLVASQNISSLPP